MTTQVSTSDRDQPGLAVLVDVLRRIFKGNRLPSDEVLLTDIDLFQMVPKGDRKRLLRAAKKAYINAVVQDRVDEIVSSCEADSEMMDVELSSFRSDIQTYPYLTKAEQREWVKLARSMVTECLELE